MKGLALDSGEFISADELNARIPQSKPDNWQQYATMIEETAQAVIERHRGEIKSLLNLLAKDRGELQALRAQIGQGEPVAWKHDCAVLLANDVELWIDVCPHCGKPRHHPAPQSKPLTDEQIEDLYFDEFSISKLKEFARAIEAAHNIGEKK